jgi:uncharacterized protein YjbI with pentapeptide repeats
MIRSAAAGLLSCLVALGLLAAGCGDSDADATPSAPAPARLSADDPDDVREECQQARDEDDEGRLQRQGASIAELTFTEPPGQALRCVVFSDSNLPAMTVQGVDLAGADFTAADLTGSTFQSANLVAADFTGATLRNVDFGTSDLRGATFTDADLVGATLGALEGALTGVTFLRAKLGCNDLTGSPDMDLTDVSLLGGDADDDGTLDCAEAGATLLEMQLGGSFQRAVMPSFDFALAVVSSTDFREADLSGARMFDKGVWPDGSDFRDAVMVGADLSRTGFFDADFGGADLSGARLTGTYVQGSSFEGVVMEPDIASTDLRELESVENRWAGAVISGVDLSGARLLRDDLTGAMFDAETKSRLDGLVLTEVICPDGTPSVRTLGVCGDIEAARLVSS